jgi:hypothetical protein
MSGAKTEKKREQVHLNPPRPLVMYGKQIASASYAMTVQVWAI